MVLSALWASWGRPGGTEQLVRLWTLEITLPKWRLSSLLYCLGRGAATLLYLSSHQRSGDNDRAYLTGLVQGLGKLIHVKF